MKTPNRNTEQKQIERFGIHSIVTKIILLVVVVVVAVTVLLNISFYRRTTAACKELVFNYMQEVAEIYGKNVHLSLEDLKEDKGTVDYAFWTSVVDGIHINGMPGSYGYVVDRNGIMCYHPTPEKIGELVENTVINELVFQLKSGQTPAQLKTAEYLYHGVEKYVAYSLIQDGDYILVVTVDEAEAMATANQTVIDCVWNGVYSMIFYIIIGIALSIAIIRPIRNLSEVAGRIGELDFRQSDLLLKIAQRKDETGAAGRAIEQLRSHLAYVIGKIASETMSIDQASEEMNQQIQTMTVTMGQVNTAVQDIADGATTQADETQKATDNVLLMGDMIAESAEEMEQLEDNSKGMRMCSEEAEETLDILEGINQKASDAIDVIYNQTHTTNASALKIKEAADLITSIAEETNLLSLNASIEAARAGEQGRGFAVVAGQIQKLAEQSNDSAKQIEDVVAALIMDSQKAVTTMNDVKEIIKIQNEKVVKTKDSFQKVQQGVEKTAEGIHQVSDRMERMDQARSNVVAVVQNLTAIAQENAASTEQTSASVAEVGESMNRIAKNSTQLKQVVDTLENEIKAFQI